MNNECIKIVIGNQCLPGSSSRATIQDVTYAEFVDMLQNSRLVPLQWYRITDYRTVRVIGGGVNPMNGTLEYWEEEIEPIRVLALTNNSYDKRAISEVFPMDEIWWCHRKPIECDSSSGGMNIPHTGYIYYRKDTAGNETWYDFRGVKNRRWLDWDVTYASSPLFGGLSVSIKMVTPIGYGPGYIDVSNNDCSLSYLNAPCKLYVQSYGIYDVSNIEYFYDSQIWRIYTDFTYSPDYGSIYISFYADCYTFGDYDNPYGSRVFNERSVHMNKIGYKSPYGSDPDGLPYYGEIPNIVVLEGSRRNIIKANSYNITLTGFSINNELSYGVSNVFLWACDEISIGANVDSVRAVSYLQGRIADNSYSLKFEHCQSIYFEQFCSNLTCNALSNITVRDSIYFADRTLNNVGSRNIRKSDSKLWWEYINDSGQIVLEEIQ